MSSEQWVAGRGGHQTVGSKSAAEHKVFGSRKPPECPTEGPSYRQHGAPIWGREPTSNNPVLQVRRGCSEGSHLIPFRVISCDLIPWLQYSSHMSGLRLGVRRRDRSQGSLPHGYFGLAETQWDFWNHLRNQIKPPIGIKVNAFQPHKGISTFWSCASLNNRGWTSATSCDPQKQMSSSETSSSRFSTLVEPRMAMKSSISSPLDYPSAVDRWSTEYLASPSSHLPDLVPMRLTLFIS